MNVIDTNWAMRPTVLRASPTTTPGSMSSMVT